MHTQQLLEYIQLQACAGIDAGAKKAALLDQAALESQAPISVQETPLQHTSATAAVPVPDGRDYRQAEPPTHYHTPQPVVETLDQVLQAVVATQFCADEALSKSNSTITLSDDSVEILAPEEAAQDDADVVVLDETTSK